MSNAKTGLLSALGALVGGAAGAAAGHYAAKYRPRARYANAPRAQEVEDAMVIGGAAGAVVGAFIGGTVAGDDEPLLLAQNPKR
jgi:uncharacterized membrane protein YfcA